MDWKTVLLIIATLLFVAACSGRSSSRVGENGTQTAPTAASAGEPTTGADVGASKQTTPGQRVQGGTLLRLWNDPPTLDPHQTTDVTSATIIVEVFGGLVTIDKGLNIVGDLAETWDMSPDGRVYTFHLRPNAKFHNGKLITAQDFKWSMERASDPQTAAPVVDEYLGDIVGVTERLRGDATEVQGLRVIDGHTLEITIDEPKAYFLAKLTYPTAFVLDRENVESSRLWFREPNGSGPFKFSDYAPGERFVLARNENYHLAPPFLDKVHFILGGGTSMLMYENDEIHLTGVGLADLDRVLDPSNALSTEIQRAPPSFSTTYIGMNVDEPPFDDLKVRQALNYAIDKEEITKSVLAGLVVPARGILPPGFPAYNENLEGYGYDPDLARQLLAESKYGPNLENFGKPIILTTAGSFGSSVSLDMEVILAMWEKNLGIKVETLQTEFATYLQDLIKRRFEMFQIGWIADYPDPENFLDLLFHSKSNNNHTAYNNQQVDGLLERARVEPREDVRYQIYQEAEQLIVRDAPWIPLWYSGEQYVLVKPYVHDYFLTELVIPKLRFVYMTKR